MEKDALWRKQITAFHEEDGGLGRAVPGLLVMGFGVVLVKFTISLNNMVWIWILFSCNVRINGCGV